MDVVASYVVMKHHRGQGCFVVAACLLCLFFLFFSFLFFLPPPPPPPPPSLSLSLLTTNALSVVGGSCFVALKQ